MKPISAKFIFCLATAAAFGWHPTLSDADNRLLPEVFGAFQKIEAQLQVYTEQDTFEGLLQAAKTEVQKIQGTEAVAGCGEHFDRAINAYDIINEIWRLQEHDNTIDAGYACVAVDKYKLWLKLFPALLTWKWGKSGVGVSTLEEARFEPFDCCLILKPFLDDIWAPCLFYEARRAVRRAGECLTGPDS